MTTANQLTFTTYEASLKLKPNDPVKINFHIDWSFIHPLVKTSILVYPKELRATTLFPYLVLPEKLPSGS